MYTIQFYEDTNGKSELWDFLEELRTKAATSKDARIQYRQVSLYIQLLQDNIFVLLHQFRKKSQKTPQRELKKAKAERDDYLVRKEADKNEDME